MIQHAREMEPVIPLIACASNMIGAGGGIIMGIPKKKNCEKKNKNKMRKGETNIFALFVSKEKRLLMYPTSLASESRRGCI